MVIAKIGLGRIGNLPAVLGLLCAVASGPALAEGDPAAADPIIRAACATCHQIPGYPSPESTAGGAAANWQDIADGSQYDTAEKLSAFLSVQHYPVPGFAMSPEDVDNVVAFILSLRD